MLVVIEDEPASRSARSPAPAKLISRLAHTKALLRDSLASENAERLRRASELHREQLEMVRLRAGRASERAREAVARKSHLDASAKARALSKVADVNSRATFASAAASVRQAAARARRAERERLVAEARSARQAHLASRGDSYCAQAARASAKRQKTIQATKEHARCQVQHALAVAAAMRTGKEREPAPVRHMPSSPAVRSTDDLVAPFGQYAPPSGRRRSPPAGLLCRLLSKPHTQAATSPARQASAARRRSAWLQRRREVAARSARPFSPPDSRPTPPATGDDYDDVFELPPEPPAHQPAKRRVSFGTVARPPSPLTIDVALEFDGTPPLPSVGSGTDSPVLRPVPRVAAAVQDLGQPLRSLGVAPPPPITIEEYTPEIYTISSLGSLASEPSSISPISLLSSISDFPCVRRPLASPYPVPASDDDDDDEEEEEDGDGGGGNFELERASGQPGAAGFAQRTSSHPSPAFARSPATLVTDFTRKALRGLHFAAFGVGPDDEGLAADAPDAEGCDLGADERDLDAEIAQAEAVVAEATAVLSEARAIASQAATQAASSSTTDGDCTPVITRRMASPSPSLLAYRIERGVPAGGAGVRAEEEACAIM